MDIASTPEPIITFIKPISTDEYNKQGSDFTQKALLELKEQMKNFKPNKHSIIQKNIDVINKNNCIIESNSNSDSDSDSDSVSDYNLSDKDDKDEDVDDDNTSKNTRTNTNINLIIKNVKSDAKSDAKKTTKKDKKKTNESKSKESRQSKESKESKESKKSSDITNAVFDKMDNDSNKILQLNNKIVEYKSVCKKMDKDLHYLKLDLVNFQCDNDKLLKETASYNKKIVELENIVKHSDDKANKQEKYMQYLKIFIIILLLLNAYFDYVKYILLFSSVICFYF
jgi:hypothetical protein